MKQSRGQSAQMESKWTISVFMGQTELEDGPAD